MSDAPVPGDNPRRDELRLYLVVREDLAMPRALMASVAARATWAALSLAAQTGDSRLSDYDRDSQPKVALRVKNEGQLLRVLAEAEAVGIPAGMVTAADGVPAAVGLGPVRRGDLPKFTATQRLLTENELGEGSPSGDMPPLDEDQLVVWVLPRRSIHIPYGKLAPQAGHALWSAVSEELGRSPEQVATWEASGFPVAVTELADLAAMKRVHQLAADHGLGSSFIVDQGRTCFNEPTATVVGLGPARLRDLPDEMRQMMGYPPASRLQPFS